MTNYIVNHIEICAHLATVVGFFWGLYVFIRKSRLERASAVYRMLFLVKNNSGFSNIFYSIEYNKFYYSSAFHKTKEEQEIDSLLTYLSHLCYLKDIKVLTPAEFRQFEYYLDRVLLNHEVQNYLYNIYHFSKASKSKFTYTPLLRYAKVRNFIGDDFESVDSNSKYTKVLNF